ncbi:hypothetical protein LINPERHAP1_LOCUS18631, partial [Linum perenne]
EARGLKSQRFDQRIKGESWRAVSSIVRPPIQVVCCGVQK